MSDSRQRPYLNLGCGKIILPAARPGHHALINPAIYDYALWHNVDKIALSGVDEVIDIFTYPWLWVDNSFDGALLSHIAEHIPHEIRLRDDSPRAKELAQMQDGWYAFFAELYRVLTPGALIHVLSPYAWSAGAVTDPTHTRLITEHTFSHSMTPDSDGPFQYANGGVHYEIRALMFNPTPLFADIVDDQVAFTRALQTRLNVVYELYVQLEVVKDE